MINSNEEWALFLSAKFKTKNGQWITKWKQSSIWKGLKWAWNYLKEDIRLSIGDGTKISVWFDTWIGEVPLIEQIGYSEYVKNNIGMKVANLRKDNSWTFEKVRDKEPTLVSPTYIWKPFLHPNIASNIWKLHQGVYMDDDEMKKIGYDMVSRCCICQEKQDNMDHTLWHCRFSLEIWSWLCSIFGFRKPISFEDICSAAKRKSPIVREIWLTTACATMRELWFQRNKILFEEMKPHNNSFKCRIYKLIQEGIHRMKEASSSTASKKINWTAPVDGVTLFFCAGKSFGEPGNAGLGVIARDCNSKVIGTLTGGIGVASSSIAGEYAIICALEWVVFLKCTNIIIQSYSITEIECFKSTEIPWYIWARWKKASMKLAEVTFSQCPKEINFTANNLAQRGAVLKAGERIIHSGRPHFLKRIELQGVAYLSLC
ncbi:uncharacterized protein LOC113352645 [Papaver somniferum]|uniref:uncharacterized protein LOC113352645 n=1 Tax=Papaver somniferum TaxID=3469 RepID=UPI000E6F51B5|nr:uncharacterized protein LOC113352645 [Papaver somniferum]